MPRDPSFAIDSDDDDDNDNTTTAAPPTAIAVVIGGGIGSGKSSTANEMIVQLVENGMVTSEKQILRLIEPVEKWEVYLTRVYDKTATSAKKAVALFELQLSVVEYHRDILRQLCDLERGIRYVIIERSPQESLDIFMAANKAFMTPKDYSMVMYTMKRLVIHASPLWKRFERGIFDPNAVHVFLDQTVDECMRRIQLRARESELQKNSTLDRSYMETLETFFDAYADKYFAGKDEKPHAANIFRIPPDLNASERATKIIHFLQKK